MKVLFGEQNSESTMKSATEVCQELKITDKCEVKFVTSMLDFIEIFPKEVDAQFFHAGSGQLVLSIKVLPDKWTREDRNLLLANLLSGMDQQGADENSDHHIANVTVHPSFIIAFSVMGGEEHRCNLKRSREEDDERESKKLKEEQEPAETQKDCE